MPDLPLHERLSLGFMATAFSVDAARAVAERAERGGWDSVWTGDHLAFPLPILDPLLQLAQIAAFNPCIQVGTAVYLLPLRRPGPVAKQVATLDHLSGGRLIFGVGIGGEFPKEYEVAGVPREERGARMSEAIEILKKLLTGEPVSHHGRFERFERVAMRPAPVQPGGPPIWCGGRQEAALRRIGRLGDGWVSYAIDPARYRKGLETIAGAAREAGREPQAFGTGHLLFCWVDDSHELAFEKAVAHLSARYAMDFSAPAKRYAAVGTAADVAARIADFREAGVRHVIVDPTGPFEESAEQIDRLAEEVLPLLPRG